ncbi:MAG TPA: hypothetical protein VNK91_01885 [Burkholderiaceae bacterium]|nr:hypothetical protein [Burkholderiaceae bacterium]
MAGSPRKRERLDRLAALIGDPATLRELCCQIAEGTTVLEWCRAHDVPYSEVSAWLAAEPERRAKVDAALQLRGEYLSEMVIRNLRLYADVDIAQAYGSDGQLLPIQQMPESVRRAIQAFEVVDHENPDDAPSRGPTRTRKVRLVSPERAVELLGKYRRLFVDRVEHGADESLEELLTRSREPEPPE